jgi:hypothetical protein
MKNDNLFVLEWTTHIPIPSNLKSKSQGWHPRMSDQMIQHPSPMPQFADENTKMAHADQEGRPGSSTES